MADFLWEIGCEEIPARMQKNAQETLQRMVTQYAKSIAFQGVQTYCAPRHLAIRLHNVTPIVIKPEIKQGPLVDLGAQALAGFCRTWGIEPEACTPVLGPKGMIWCATINPKQESIETQLISLCTSILKDMFWPKRMRWCGDFSWIRPIRWLLTLYGDQPLSWSWNDVVAGSWSEAHRLAPHGDFFDFPTDILYQNTPLSRFGMRIASAETYTTQLAHSGVMVDAQARSERILADITALAVEYGGMICAETQDALVQENAGLTHWPKAVVCDFDPVFLSLPVEVITTTLQVHQKCFSIKSSTDPEKLLPHFIMIADGPLPTAEIQQGYQRVVQARLADALFFWSQDLKTPLIQRIPHLAKRSFFQDLGTLYDKTQRVRSLVAWLADLMPPHTVCKDALDQAASLSKADLLTAMVAEFPTLQGVMGKYYAEKQDALPQVGLALQQSYDYPRHNIDCLKNNTLYSALLAIADGIDTLVGFFALGRMPSGSKDPMALRRACHGVIKAMVAKNIAVDIAACIHYSLTAYNAQGFLSDISPETLTNQLLGFVYDRVAYLLKEANLPTDIKHIKEGAMGKNSVEIWHTAQQLACMTHHHGDFLGAYRRVYALVSQMSTHAADHDFQCLQHPLEREILKLLEQPLVTAGLPGAGDGSDRGVSGTAGVGSGVGGVGGSAGHFPTDLSTLLPLWTLSLHAFFDGIKVQEEPYTSARLGLLKDIMTYFQPLGPLPLLVM